jgi:hypothetical protein
VLLDCQSAQRAAAEASRKRAAAAQAQAEANNMNRAAADDSDRKMSDGGRMGGAAPTLAVWRRLVCLCASACLHLCVCASVCVVTMRAVAAAVTWELRACAAGAGC